MIRLTTPTLKLIKPFITCDHRKIVPHSATPCQVDNHQKMRRTGTIGLLEAVSGCRFAADYALSPEGEVAVRLVLRNIDRRLEKVLRLRFGIDCRPHTLDEIKPHLRNHHSGRLGVQRERVRQIERGALRVIRRWHYRMLRPDVDAAFLVAARSKGR